MIFNKVTLQTLKRNRTRTLVTIIGVILSTAMITAVTALIVSLQGYMLESTTARVGDWHGAGFSVSADTLLALQQNDELSSLAAMQNVGYARLPKSENEYKPYLFVAGFSDALYDTLPVKVLAGRLPASSEELMLPDHLARNGGIKYQIGDSVTLELGQRVADGQGLNQHDSYLSAVNGEPEEFIPRQKRSYRIVGIYERPAFESYSAAGYTAITRADADFTAAFDYDCYFKVQKPAAIYTFIEANLDAYATETNSALLLFLGVSHHNSFRRVLYSLGGILIALIMFGSISLIYNAFAISVSERSKQFGLLASVGATKAQLRRTVYFEALVVSAIGIPLGLLAGLLGIHVTLYFVGDMFDAIVMDAGIPMTLVISPVAIGLAAAIALLTVLISAALPARRANKLTPIAAIRQTQDIAVRPGQVKTSRLTGKLFGLSGVLARKNFKRQRGKHRSTIVSLTLSIVLFISATAFTGYLKAGTGFVFEQPTSDIHYTMGHQTEAVPAPDEVFALLAAVPGVTKSMCYTSLMATTDIPEQLLNQTLDPRFLVQNGEELPNGDFQTTVLTYFLPDEAFREFAGQAKADPAIFFAPGAPQAIAYDRILWWNSTEDKYLMNSFFAQQQATELTLESPEDAEPTAVRVAAFAEQAPFGLDSMTGHCLVLILPEYHWSAFAAQTAFATTHMDFEATDHGAAYKAMQSLLIAQAYDTSTLTDLAAATANDRNTLTIINVFSYGFIVLISLIAVANVFNTIYTNIQLRRREFAMLKSVGMTPHGFNKMMRYECAMYALQGIFYGLPLAYAVTYLIYRSIIQGVGLAFTLPLASSLIAVLSTFLIVFITNAYALRNVRKENIVDALQNENL